MIEGFAALLENDEGRRYYPYVDTRGKVTIGVGHNLTDRGLTDSQIELILADDIAVVEEDLGVIVPNWRDQPIARQLVLASMAYQLGGSGLAKFRRMLRFFGEGDYDSAAGQMLSSLWATQTPKRAQRLARMMRTGITEA